MRTDTHTGSATPADLIAALTVLRQLREELAGWEPELITAAREQNVNWAALAPALGVTSRQAAERRYLRLATLRHRRTDRRTTRRCSAPRRGLCAAWTRRN